MRRLFFPLLVLLLAVPASAHPVLQNSMWMLIEQDHIRVAVNVTLQEILVTGRMVAKEDGAFDAEAVNAAAEAHREYLRTHLHLAASGAEIAGKVVAVTPPPIFSSAEKTLYQYELDYPLAGAPPVNIELRHDMLREFPYGPGQAWDVSYLVRVKRAGSEESTTWLLRGGEPTTLPTGWEAAPVQVPAATTGVSRPSGPIPPSSLFAVIAAMALALALYLTRRRWLPR
jgi:hypothetical protein